MPPPILSDSTLLPISKTPLVKLTTLSFADHELITQPIRYGQGLPKDYVEAVRWYRKSAEQGDANAQYSFSFAYHEGKGVPQDDSESAQWC